jgi:aryl sulfotransferase
MSAMVWLVSYVKSGNTWLRVFMANLLRNDGVPLDINSIPIPIASNRSVFDKLIGVESSDLTAGEIDRLRPEVYRRLGMAGPATPFIKVHDAYTCLPDGSPLFPAESCRGAIYIVRNPLDVVVSFANHSGLSLDQAIANMGNPGYCLASNPRSLQLQLRQKLLTWSAHVESWLEQKEIPVHLMRYEDMQADPVAAFGAAVRFAGIDGDEAAIRRALEFSRFKNLQAQERQNGFIEKPAAAGSFFREGRTGGWRDALTKQQVERVARDHGAVMKRLGYLDS